MARTEGQWKKGTTSVTPIADLPILLQNDYLNFGGVIAGDLGYGIRDNGGVIEVKNSSGTWEPIPSSAISAGWDYYAVNWSLEPTSLGLITGGEVFSYTLGATTRYRFVPTVYDATQDAFYTTFSSPTLSGLIVARG